jgi:predicted dehydrogenase
MGFCSHCASDAKNPVQVTKHALEAHFWTGSASSTNQPPEVNLIKFHASTLSFTDMITYHLEVNRWLLDGDHLATLFTEQFVKTTSSAKNLQTAQQNQRT